MKFLYAPLVVLAVLFAACGGSDDSKPSTSNDTGSATSSGTVTTQSGSSSSSSSSGSSSSSSDTKSSVPSLAPVVEKIRPSTVQVMTKVQVPFNLAGMGQGTVPQGIGTGVIYDKEGYVLTNAHVIEGATETQVAMSNGEIRPAKIVGSDPRTDLAVLQISGSSLTVATLGDSSKLKVGDWTVAIGHALGLPGGPTVTAGVLSATGRAVQEPSEDGSGGPYLFDMLQTDAAINPGNSGGPLVNLNGDVVGINTLVAGSAGNGLPAQGIGFAISINTAKGIADQLVKNGKVIHPSLGVTYVPTTAAIASEVGLKSPTGAAIIRVAPGSAAAKAGLRPGDIVLKVDGKEVKNESDLPRYIDQKQPGDKITMTVWRDGKEQQIEATLDQASTQ
jgi:S1-C subfamily serine protease